MSDAVLLFTFSPVQSFISEARRAADLYTGSQILVELAKAAGEAIKRHTEKNELVYPAELADEVPNKLVARVPWEKCESIAQEAHAALLKRWRDLAEEARLEFLRKTDLPFDAQAWERQIGDEYLWEVYWSAASLDGRDYKDAYPEAEQGLGALKFTRPFHAYLEPGFKDTLSGKREALHSKDQNGREYWFQVGKIPAITPILIRPSTEKGPRERLDALGVVKRFHPRIAEKEIPPFSGFPSTSSIASLDYLEQVRTDLTGYRAALSHLFGERDPLMRVRKEDPDFPYDGDFLYLETLTSKRLGEDYRIEIEKANITAHIDNAKSELKKLKGKPSPYYAILVLDGDGMGEFLRTLDEQGHKQFSRDLHTFTLAARESMTEHNARIVYNGGDDVLAFAPLESAFAFAKVLAKRFQEVTGRTASAGIAISHHLSPLGAALRAAREAEHQAKKLRKEKNAVCIIALKRSGEPIQVRSGWEGVEPFDSVIEAFKNDLLSSRLPYDVVRSAYALPVADEKFEAELRRLLIRHWQKGKAEEKQAQARSLAENLCKWAASFVGSEEMSQTDQLAGWLALARFVAKGGRE